MALNSGFVRGALHERWTRTSPCASRGAPREQRAEGPARPPL